MKKEQINAAFAGLSYPETPQEIVTQFREQLDIFRNGRRPELPKVPPILIVPHIDFRVNLDIYAQTYAHLSVAKQFPKTFYILGVGHQCPHEFSAVDCHYSTPLGEVFSDGDILANIEKSCGFNIARSPATFRKEHSLEFVVIWLQVLRDLYFPNSEFKIVPILLSGMYETITSGRLPDDSHEISCFSRAVADSFRQHAEHDGMIIASIDGCHVGPRFDHDFAANEEVQEAVQQWEAELWRLCRSDKLDDFIQHLHRVENAFYFDGVGVLTLLLRNFSITAQREAYQLWYEESDMCFVTYSGGYCV